MSTWFEKNDEPPFQSYGSENQSVMGLFALIRELKLQGIQPEAVLAKTGLSVKNISEPLAQIKSTQKKQILSNAHELSRLPDTALRSGQGQSLADFGVYGYALMSSATFGDAVHLGMKYIRLAGPVLQKKFYVQNQVGIFKGLGWESIGELLPFSTEFWFSSMLRLVNCVLETPITNLLLRLPYPRPEHGDSYEQLFQCPVEFNAPTMEWHIDARVLSKANQHANPMMGNICTQFCERLNQTSPEPTAALPHIIYSNILDISNNYPNASGMAKKLGMSERTLHRKLAKDGFSYLELMDKARSSIAIELLKNTSLSNDEISERLGFSSSSNFRKAFKRWLNASPSEYRRSLNIAMD